MAFDPTQAEGLGTDSLEESSSMPIIRIIQDQSPEQNKRKEEYIEGAEAGMLMFNPTKELLPAPLEFIPLAVRSLYVEWVPKEKGGGVVATHPLSIVSHPSYRKGVKTRYDEWLGENELKYTSYWLVLFLKNGEWEKGMLAMSSTQLRVARELSTKIDSFRWNKVDVKPPIFARTWKLSSKTEKNGADQEYFNFAITEPRILDFKKDEALLNMAQAAHMEAVKSLPEANKAPDAAALPPKVEQVEDVELEDAF